MAKTKRNGFQIERDRQAIARLTLRGVTQAEIAKTLKMTQPMVCYDLAAVRNEWRAREAVELADARAFVLAKLDELDRTYWEAFQKSTNGNTRAGNVRFLNGVFACIVRRCRLLALDKPGTEAVVESGEATTNDLDPTFLLALQRVYGADARRAIEIQAKAVPSPTQNGSIDPKSPEKKPKLKLI